MLELGGGLTGRINANVSVFANVDYEFAVGATENEKMKRRSGRVWRPDTRGELLHPEARHRIGRGLRPRERTPMS